MLSDLVSSCLDRGGHELGGLTILGQGSRHVYILCGPASGLTLQKVPEEDRCVTVAPGQAMMWKRKWPETGERGWPLVTITSGRGTGDATGTQRLIL